MEAFVKSFSTYRTIKKATVISSAIVEDAMEAEASMVVVRGSEIGYDDVGNWLILDASVFWITSAKPESDRTTLGLSSPLDAFSRLMELSEQSPADTVGDFICSVLSKNWTEGDDPAYAVPYLIVSNSDATPFVAPDLDTSGCFDLPAYCRLMRKSYRTVVRFSNAGTSLQCTVSTAAALSRRIIFSDGRSQLQRAEFSSTGVAKVTALCDVDAGFKDAAGEAVIERTRSVWYLSASGEISQKVPEHRASGKWTTIVVKKPEEIEAKVIETFAKNKAGHKLEFFSVVDLDVQDECMFLVHGKLLQSYITYKRKSSSDNRYFYKAGELATTATEKLRGVLK